MDSKINNQKSILEASFSFIRKNWIILFFDKFFHTLLIFGYGLVWFKNGPDLAPSYMVLLFISWAFSLLLWSDVVFRIYFRKYFGKPKISLLQEMKNWINPEILKIQFYTWQNTLVGKKNSDIHHRFREVFLDTSNYNLNNFTKIHRAATGEANYILSSNDFFKLLDRRIGSNHFLMGSFGSFTNKLLKLFITVTVLLIPLLTLIDPQLEMQWSQISLVGYGLLLLLFLIASLISDLGLNTLTFEAYKLIQDENLSKNELKLKLESLGAKIYNTKKTFNYL